jgi:hypothetical protein
MTKHKMKILSSKTGKKCDVVFENREHELPPRGISKPTFNISKNYVSS